MSTETSQWATSHPGISDEAVKAQLATLLQSSLFSQSRRYPSFLRHVVEQSLCGKQHQLKERSIGVAVFARDQNYEVHLDPVVRVTAGEVRKRLAQYYYDPSHRDELRIILHPGSYVPEFRVPLESHTTLESASRLGDAPQERPPVVSPILLPLVPAATPLPQPAMLAPTAALSQRLRTAGLLAGLVLAGIATSSVLFVNRAPTPLDRVWQPIWKDPSAILIAIGSPGSLEPSPTTTSIGTHARSNDPIALADGIAAASLQQWLSQRNKVSQIRSSTRSSFADLQQGSTVLISAYDNPWTMRLIAPLRFHFAYGTPNVLYIEDRNDPSNRHWLIDNQTAYAALSHDYAIIARFHDATTERNVVVAAGIGEDGTLAASQILTDPNLFNQTVRGSVLDAPYNNMEAVIETLVIDGKSGPPRIVASHVW